MSNSKRFLIHRPLLHHFIFIPYILSSVGNLVVFSLIGNKDLGFVVSNLFAYYGVLGGFWILTAPIVGILIYRVHPSSWYLFLLHSGLILIDYISKWVTQPAWYFGQAPLSLTISFMIGNLLLIVCLGYFFTRDFMSPYFQVLPRSFREKKRIPLYHYIHLDGFKVTISDISSAGCFVSEVHDDRFQLGQRYSVRLQFGKALMTCQGEIVQASGDGYGIKFSGLSAAQKTDIEGTLQKRFALRYMTKLPCRVRHMGQEYSGTIINLSKGGCYVATDQADFEESKPVTLEFVVSNQTYIVEGWLIWSNMEPENLKAIGIGCQFTKKQTLLVQQVKKTMTTVTLTR